MRKNVLTIRAVDKLYPVVYRSIMSLLLVLLCSSLVLSACGTAEIPSVERENLFTLAIGKMEDEIDLFSLENRTQALKTRIAMDDGIFYISDTNGAKVVRFTSYGDLLSMIYNPDSNPSPLSLTTDSTTDGLSTRKAIAYPLNEPGCIAVDSRKCLYVEDSLPSDRRIFDSERRTLLDRVVLRFTADGKIDEYLGQDGVGGTPFPYIIDLQVSVDDELAVICRMNGGWEIYWFDIDGNLLYVVKVDSGDLPRPEGFASLPSLDQIHAAPDKRLLYMKIDYYRDTIDTSTDTRAGIGHEESIVWLLDVASGEFLSWMEVPLYEFNEVVNDRNTASTRIYSFMGAARDGKLFFFTPEIDGYAILMLEVGSKDRKRGFIKVASDELVYNNFHLSSDGLLSALLATEFEATIVWWRTDHFVGEPRA